MQALLDQLYDAGLALQASHPEAGYARLSVAVAVTAMRRHPHDVCKWTRSLRSNLVWGRPTLRVFDLLGQIEMQAGCRGEEHV
jgi:hypothetical protein